MTSAKRRKLLQQREQMSLTKQQQQANGETTEEPTIPFEPKPLIIGRHFFADWVQGAVDDEGIEEPNEWQIYRMADFIQVTVEPQIIYSHPIEEEARRLIERLDELHQQAVDSFDKSSR